MLTVLSVMVSVLYELLCDMNNSCASSWCDELVYVDDYVHARFRPLPGVQKSEDIVETLRQSESRRRCGANTRHSHMETRRPGH